MAVCIPSWYLTDCQRHGTSYVVIDTNTDSDTDETKDVSEVQNLGWVVWSACFCKSLQVSVGASCWADRSLEGWKEHIFLHLCNIKSSQSKAFRYVLDPTWFLSYAFNICGESPHVPLHIAQLLAILTIDFSNFGNTVTVRWGLAISILSVIMRTDTTTDIETLCANLQIAFAFSKVAPSGNKFGLQRSMLSSFMTWYICLLFSVLLSFT